MFTYACREEPIKAKIMTFICAGETTGAVSPCSWVTQKKHVACKTLLQATLPLRARLLAPLYLLGILPVGQLEPSELQDKTLV